MKSVAAALVLVASAADVAAPALVAPAVVLGVSTFARWQPAPAAVRRQIAMSNLTEVRQQASRSAPHAG